MKSCQSIYITHLKPTEVQPKVSTINAHGLRSATIHVGVIKEITDTFQKSNFTNQEKICGKRWYNPNQSDKMERKIIIKWKSTL